ncbi:MAG TPA: APC family permease, partial [bacterium]|nr:APC family permease [bacterium]
SKLLSPRLGMASGCALLIDYLLTIALSIASGTDALFSSLPARLQPLKIFVSIAAVLLLVLLNLRGVKESVVSLTPVFIVFIVMHGAAIVTLLLTHLPEADTLVNAARSDIGSSIGEAGVFGTIFLIFRAYSMGAGTYTGIEAVSNGLPILREPREKTAKRTMLYMAVSLAFMALGLTIGYLLYGAGFHPTKTLNAVLFESATAGWGDWGHIYVLVALVSEAAILVVAAQTGFLDGPRVLANMAKDRWVPTQFSMLSDRFVTQNGILIMGGAAFLLMLLTHGSVRFLVVLYSINVFITFSLSQLGMVRHWWQERRMGAHWKHRILVNGIGLVLTLFILASVVVLKFHQGGWITLLITGTLIVLVTLIRRHYNYTARLLGRLDSLVQVAEKALAEPAAGGQVKKPAPEFDPKGRTAVLLVNGFSGLGLHTLLGIIRVFQDSFRNFVFIQIGILDSGNFKGSFEIEHLKTYAETEVDKYVEYMQRHGYYAERFTTIGVDVVEEVAKIVPEIMERFPHPVFFGGQLVFPHETVFNRALHNYTVFAVQRRLYTQGIPIVIMPIRVY